MRLFRSIAAAAALLATAPLAAQDAPASQAPAPKLVVVISVDQFSADLFAEYRNHFTGGFARLLSGAVFPAGYQSHAATETCPGHSTILTGNRPAHTGIVANDWYDFKAPRQDKKVYCAEDENAPGSNSDSYTVADAHLKVPTLGEWMKAAHPGSRVVSVSGKDRSAVMMGGHVTDEIWWWDGKGGFTSYAGRAMPPMVARMNAGIAARLGEAQEPMDLGWCATKSRAIPLGGGKTVGDGRFARAAGDSRAYRASPEFDESILATAAGLAKDMRLGQGADTDLLIVGASGTDYVGHTFGTQGSEMCLQLMALDQYLGKFFAVLDQTGVDYVVALTADHGGLDLPERAREQGAPDAARIDPALVPGAMGKAIAAQLGLGADSVLVGSAAGDVYIVPSLNKAQHDAVLAEAVKRYSAHPQVQAVFTRAQIEATAMPKGPPETWSLLERARASYSPDRSGDFIIALRPRITPIVSPLGASVATHGSFWDYDRRVPILFWRKGMTGFEQPLSVETVDIAPTLAALIHVPVPGPIDGRCLDLDAGVGNSCS